MEDMTREEFKTIMEMVTVIIEGEQGQRGGSGQNKKPHDT